MPKEGSDKSGVCPWVLYACGTPGCLSAGHIPGQLPLWGSRRVFSKSGDVWCDVTSGLVPAVSAPPATEFATPACSGGWRATVRHKVRLDCTSGFGRAMPHHLAPACFSRCCSVHSRRSPLPTCLPVCLLACLFALPCSGGGCLFGGLGLVCTWAIGPSPVVA